MYTNDLLEEFIFGCKIRKFSERTIKSYTNNIKTKRYLQSVEDKDIVAMSITTSPLMNL